MRLLKSAAHPLPTALLMVLLQALAQPAWACRVCRPRVQAIIHAPDYSHNIALVLLPVAVLLLLGVGLFFASPLTRRLTSSSSPHDQRT